MSISIVIRISAWEASVAGDDDDPEVRFTMDGRRFRLRRSEVVTAMKGVPAEPVRSHSVRVGGTWYPVKQVMARCVDVDRSDFISTAARRQLRQLGFELRHD
jgi:hypothetical protein